MRWLAKWLLQDSYLELEGGATVYYPNQAFGPAYILPDKERYALERFYAWGAWALFALFVFPAEVFEARIVPLIGDFVGVSFVALGIWLAPFLLLLVLFGWCKDRVLERSERRDPSMWSADLEHLKAACKTQKKASIVGPLLGVIFAGILIKILLETLLLRMHSP